jgi:hypothetical protein
MVSAVLRGLLGSQTSMTYRCASNCRWNDTYVTLGFESICHNVTKETLASQVCVLPNDPRYTGGYDRNCNMTTPGGIELVDPYFMMQSSAIRFNRDIFWDGWSTRRGQISPTFATVVFIRSSNFVKVGYPSITPFKDFTECDLRLVAWRYTDLVATGSQLHIGTTQKFILKNGTYTEASMLAADEADNASLLDVVFSSGEGWPDLFIRAGDLAALADIFNDQPFVGDDAMIGGNSMLKQALFTGNITETFEKVARSMTDYVRMGPGSQLAQGYRVEKVVFVQVQWAWLALPTLTVLVAAFLLIFTAIRSARLKELGLWKDSTIAILLTYLNSDDGTLRIWVKEPSTVDKLARSSRVRIKGD